MDLSDDLSAVETIREACQRIGFFTIRSHGVDPQLAEELRREGRVFFDLPYEKKSEYSIAEMQRSRGYEISPQVRPLPFSPCHTDNPLQTSALPSHSLLSTT